jgi:hypothetical protein
VRLQKGAGHGAALAGLSRCAHNVGFSCADGSLRCKCVKCGCGCATSTAISRECMGCANLVLFLFLFLSFSLPIVLQLFRSCKCSQPRLYCWKHKRPLHITQSRRDDQSHVGLMDEGKVMQCCRVNGAQRMHISRTENSHSYHVCAWLQGEHADGRAAHSHSSTTGKLERDV